MQVMRYIGGQGKYGKVDGKWLLFTLTLFNLSPLIL